MTIENDENKKYKFHSDIVLSHIVYDKYNNFVVNGENLSCQPDSSIDLPFLQKIKPDDKYMLLLKRHMLGHERDIQGLYLYSGYDTTTKTHEWTNVPLVPSLLISLDYHVHQTTDENDNITWSYTEEKVVPKKIPEEVTTVIVGLTVFIAVILIGSLLYVRFIQGRPKMDDHSPSDNKDTQIM
jgi:hypothetical protein